MIFKQKREVIEARVIKADRIFSHVWQSTEILTRKIETCYIQTKKEVIETRIIEEDKIFPHVWES